MRFKSGDVFPGDLYAQEYLAWSWATLLVPVISVDDADAKAAIDGRDFEIGLLLFPPVMVVVVKLGTGGDARYWHAPLTRLEGGQPLPTPPADLVVKWDLVVCQAESLSGDLSRLPVYEHISFEASEEFNAYLWSLADDINERGPVSVERLVTADEKLSTMFASGEQLWSACVVTSRPM